MEPRAVRVQMPPAFEGPGAIPLDVVAQAYEDLPSALMVEIMTDAGRWGCVPEPSCETASPRPTPPAELRLMITYAARDGAAPRRITRDIELPTDVTRLSVELRFEELVGHDHIWLARAAILRYRAEPPSLFLTPTHDNPAHRPDFDLHNTSPTATYWSVDGPHFEGGWERWDGEVWAPVAPSDTAVCGMLGPTAPLRPGATVRSQEVTARIGRTTALPTGRLRYAVRAAEVIDAGAGVPRAEARTRDAEPMLVDVFTVTHEQTVIALPLSDSDLDPIDAADGDTERSPEPSTVR